MCHKGKCFLTIPVEAACFVLAIIKAVITGILLLTSVVFAFLCVSFTIVGPIGLASVVAFTFSVLLCNGINNRLPDQVKAYFIYGVVSVILEAVAAFVLLGTMWYSGPTCAIIVLFLCALHCLFLVLVHNTYIKLFEAKPNPYLELTHECCHLVDAIFENPYWMPV